MEWWADKVDSSFIPSSLSFITSHCHCSAQLFSSLDFLSQPHGIFLFISFSFFWSILPSLLFPSFHVHDLICLILHFFLSVHFYFSISFCLLAPFFLLHLLISLGCSSAKHSEPNERPRIILQHVYPGPSSSSCASSNESLQSSIAW